MDRTSTFLSMTENDNTYRKPGAVREGNAPKVAFNDLSNRVKRVFRAGTPHKAFAEKKLAVFSEDDKPYDFCKFDKSSTSMLQKQGSQPQCSSARVTDIENGSESTRKESHFSSDENYAQEQIFVDAVDDLNESSELPDPERFYMPSHDLDYYESLPSPNGFVHASYDCDESFDFAAELTRIYPYKDDETFGLRMSPVEETEINTFMFDSEDEDDGNDSDGTYLGRCSGM